MRESNVSDMENNRRTITDKVISTISTSLKIDPSEFYIGQDTPIITNEKEKEMLRKFREAEKLNAEEEVSSMTQWIIENASKKNKSNIDKLHGKPKRVSKKAM